MCAPRPTGLVFASICARSPPITMKHSPSETGRILARRYSRRSRGSMCLGFPQARNRNGSWEWTFPVVRPERSARGLTQSRGIAWDPRISGAAPRTQPRHRKHDIYRGLGHRYANDDDDQGHLCARIRISPYLLLLTLKICLPHCFIGIVKMSGN